MGASAVRAIGRARHRCDRDRRRHVRTGRRFCAPARRHQQYQNPRRQTGGARGPWVSYARMETLRSPKHLAGPAMGLPNLAFRTWFEAKFGEPAWRDLGKIPRPMWMDYLTWYRQVLALPVENNASVLDISSAPHGYDLTVRQGVEERVLPARRIVLATGREGVARPRVPAALAGLVGPSVRHSSDDIDFTAMRGKVVAIVGFSASAVDNAAEALEAGARKVHLLVRAPDVSRINKMKHTNFPGFTAGFSMLPAKARLDLLSYVMRYRTAPPRDSVNRVFRHPNVEINLNAPLERVTQLADRLEISAGAYRFTADEIIYCTGFKIDTQAPGELGEFAPRIRTFRDSVPDDGEILPELWIFRTWDPPLSFRPNRGRLFLRCRRSTISRSPPPSVTEMSAATSLVSAMARPAWPKASRRPSSMRTSPITSPTCMPMRHRNFSAMKYRISTRGSRRFRSGPLALAPRFGAQSIKAVWQIARHRDFSNSSSEKSGGGDLLNVDEPADASQAPTAENGLDRVGAYPGENPEEPPVHVGEKPGW